MASKTVCKYHPAVPARWHCDACDADLCGGCVKKDHEIGQASCTRCSGRLRQLAARNFIAPFWSRIGKFFLYPAATTPLVFITLISVCVAAAVFLGVFVKLLLISSLVATVRYANLVLETTASGHLQAPPIGTEVFTEGWGMTLRQVVVFAVMGLATVAAYRHGGELAAQGVGLFFVLGVPASIMIMAMEKSILKAINPVAIFNVIKGIGMPYLILYGFLILVYFSYAMLDSVVAGKGNFVMLPVQVFLSLYFMIVMYNMMGYVIFQYHDALGYDVYVDLDEYDPRGDAAVTKGPTDPRLVEVEILLKEGNPDEAITVLRGHVASDNNVELHDRLHKLLKVTGKVDEMAAHAQKYIDFLVTDNKANKAAEMARDCMDAGKLVRPANDSYLLPIMNALQAQRAFKQAVAFAMNLHERKPVPGDLPRLYFLAAKTLSEHLDKDEQALRLLDFLQKNYGSHPLAGDIAKYTEMVKKLSASAPAKI